MLNHGDSEEVNLETLARDEFLRLQRQYRLMEGDKRVLNEQTGTTFDKQQRIVQFLEREREDLLVDLSNCVAPQWLEKDKETIRTILMILDQFVEHKIEVDYQLTQIREMDEQVDKITRRVIAQKLKVQAIFGNSMTISQVAKRRRILEDRLYHYTTLYDAQVTENKAVREEVTVSLIERTKFHKRYLAMKQKIQGLKNKMAEIVDEAAINYDQREEDTTKIHLLRERNDKESKSHVLEMKEAQRILHHDQKGRQFMLAKGKARKVIEEDDVRQRRMELAKERTLDDLLNAYKDSFRDILTLANIENLGTLVQSYQSQEQTNFSNFRYISDLNDEIKVVLQEIAQIKKDIDGALLVHKKIKHDQMLKMIEMDTKFRDGQHRYKKCVTKLHQMESNMEDVMKSLKYLFTIAKCDDSPILQLLGNKKGLGQKNALLGLAVLEHRISDIQTEKSLLEVRKLIEIDGIQLIPHHQNVPAGGGLKVKSTGGPYRPKVMVAGRLEESNEQDVEDDDQRSTFLPQGVLTYDEIRKTLVARLEASVKMSSYSMISSSRSKTHTSKPSSHPSSFKPKVSTATLSPTYALS